MYIHRKVLNPWTAFLFAIIMSAMSRRRIILLFVAVMALGAFLRFHWIADFPLGLYPDEAMNGNNALEALATGDFKVFYPENNGREGLYINLQAASLWLFGNKAWALRVVSAFFGTFTILGVYLVARELFTNRKSQIPISKFQTSPKFQAQSSKYFAFWKFNNWKLEIGNYEVALLSAFFTATSFWHLNFSRIGFRAILVPFFATLAMYFLLKGLRRQYIPDLVLAGLCTGLGFYTYPAFRLMPFVLIIPLIAHLWNYLKKPHHPKPHTLNPNPWLRVPCPPCAVTLFLLVTFVVALPLAVVFLDQPQFFAGRSPGNQSISVWDAESPFWEFTKSNVLTWQMFFYQGDCNWRHNLACQPQLHPIVAAFFATGILILLYGLYSHHNRRRNKTIPHPNPPPSKGGGKTAGFLPPSAEGGRTGWGITIITIMILISWTIIMSLPATLTTEGLPHALRSIGMIPPVMIIAALGAVSVVGGLIDLFEKAKARWPQHTAHIVRIQREIRIIFILVLLFLPFLTYRDYFLRWASKHQTFDAFSTDYAHLGAYLASLPQETEKFVIINVGGVDVRGLPSSSQTVMFLTDTFRGEERHAKNLKYILPAELNQIMGELDEPTIIVLLNSKDHDLRRRLQEMFPNFATKALGDFVVLQNYE